MPVQPITTSALGLDLSPRIVDSTTIVASPALAAETIIGSLAIPSFGGIAVTQRIYLAGWAAFTVGTSGTAVNLRIRQTNVTGTVIAATGALTGGIAAGNLLAQDVSGSDASPGVGTYVLTLQVTAGSAASTVSALQLIAYVV
jgi:hypothetical protein